MRTHFDRFSLPRSVGFEIIFSNSHLNSFESVVNKRHIKVDESVLFASSVIAAISQRGMLKWSSAVIPHNGDN